MASNPFIHYLYSLFIIHPRLGCSMMQCSMISTEGLVVHTTHSSTVQCAMYIRIINHQLSIKSIQFKSNQLSRTQRTSLSPRLKTQIANQQQIEKTPSLLFTPLTSTQEKSSFSATQTLHPPTSHLSIPLLLRNSPFGTYLGPSTVPTIYSLPTNYSQSHTYINIKLSHLQDLHQVYNQLPNINFLRRFFTTTPISPARMSAAKTKADGIIADNAVAVFSKSYCPYCNATKKLLGDLKANYYAIELDQVDDGSEIQSYLKEKYNQSSVPNIFIGQKHVGGNSDLQAKDKKQLETQLRELNAIQGEWNEWSVIHQSRFTLIPRAVLFVSCIKSYTHIHKGTQIVKSTPYAASTHEPGPPRSQPAAPPSPSPPPRCSSSPPRY
ncbi:hypothetical protein EYC84_007633 [Monilinia fructicola]|uniref:Glutaredoxin domain-containing protein n=2 Tax=Monilinia fructicola TaxID=38448 RepID=A0A5M9JLE5_MONFR|nr:hypothetical protein EYC84_007633 [Monilinia fructicola]